MSTVSPLSEAVRRLHRCRDPVERSRLRNDVARHLIREIERVMRQTCATRRLVGEEPAEVVQDLAERLTPAIESEGEPPRPGEEVPYVARATRNRVVDVLARKGKYKHRRYERAPSEESAYGSQQDWDGPLEQLEHSQRMALIEACLAMLPEAQRAVVQAYDLDGVPLTAIAQEWVDEGRADSLKKARQNVQQTHSRALRKLQKAILTRMQEQGL